MKKTLLMAAAALAAGIITSQAQPVYSQNIVGYVNQTLPGGLYTLVTVPLQTTSTNSAEDVFPALKQGDSILLWTNQNYAVYTFGTPGQWLYPDQATVGPAPLLPPGTSVFYNPGVSETNTYVGTAVLSNTVPVTLSGGLYNLVGSLPPIGVSSLDNTNLHLPLLQGDQVLLFNTATTTYDVWTYGGTPGLWLFPDQVTTGPSPALPVATGFFYSPGTTESWQQNLIVQ